MTPRRPGHFHAVKFYDSSAALSCIGAEFLAEGLTSRQRALVIATPSHRKAVIDELRTRHFDVMALEAAGELVMLDAQSMLASFMVAGRPDASLFQATAARQLDRLGDRPIRVFGEGVDVLWKAGLGDAAIRLEMLWNKLTLGRDIKTLCAYSVSNFYNDTSLRAIFDEHSHVVSDKGATIHAHPTVRWAGPPASRQGS
jgi:hypothetical protein